MTESKGSASFDWENLFRGMAPTDQIPEGLKGAVAQELAGHDPDQVAGMKIHELVETLKGLPNVPEYQLGGIAKRVRDFLKEMEFGTQQSAQKAGPVQVEVKFPKAPEQMPLRELLVLLLEQAEQRAEILPFIERHNTVAAAEKKTKDWVVPNADGHGIDIAETVQYAQNLARPFAQPQRTVGSHSQRPTTLRRMLGIEDRPIIHPFLLRPVQGPDDNGFDFDKLNPELHLALLWAQLSKHPAFPISPDVFTVSEEVFRKELPPRWQRILEDYREAVRREDRTALGLSRYWPEEVAYNQHLAQFSEASTTRDDEYYQRKLREASIGLRKFSSVGQSVPRKIYDSVKISGVNIYFNHAILLDGGHVSGVNVSGTVYLPMRQGIRVSGTSYAANEVNLSWEALYNKAVELGLLH